MIADTVQDRINRKAWTSWGARHWFAVAADVTDPGEAAALALVADAARGAPLLDVGVGGGRTVPTLRALSRTTWRSTTRRRWSRSAGATIPAWPCTRWTRATCRPFRRSFRPGHVQLQRHRRGGSRRTRGDPARVRPRAASGRPAAVLHAQPARPELPREPDALPAPAALVAQSLRLGFDTARIVVNLPLATINYLRHSRLNREFDGYARMRCPQVRHRHPLHRAGRAAAPLLELGLRTEAIFGNRTAMRCAGRRISAGSTGSTSSPKG